MKCRIMTPIRSFTINETREVQYNKIKFCIFYVLSQKSKVFRKSKLGLNDYTFSKASLNVAIMKPGSDKHYFYNSCLKVNNNCG